MKNERIRVIDLAKELHQRPTEILRVAKSLGINVIRAQATLASGQAFKIREHFGNRHRFQTSRPVAPLAAPPKRKSDDDLRSSICTCCKYTFTYEPHKESHELCRACREHFPQDGEPGWKALVRAEDHEKQSRDKVIQYREMNNKLQNEREEAYAKRNKWMAALVEIVVAHGPEEEGDGCVCGAPSFPCLTRRHLRDVNRGIYDRCEELEAMNEDEFNKVLYGIDYSFFREWDDGVA